ncbi:MAG: DivIVA domain-containing protein [Clostridia bacterium]|nr:DivIVA domain-containing protein [Clostridia bacterium]
MMTLDDIRNIEFSKGRGYRADEVDDFIDECVAAMEALVQENRETNQKMKVLADKLAEYRNDEDSIRGALLNAQRTGDAILRDAQAKADALTGEAQAKAEALRQELLAGLEAEREELARAKQEVAEFKNKILGLYKEHLALLKLLPEEPAEAPAETPVESAQPVTEEPVEQPEDEDADMIVVAPTTEETVRTEADEELKPLSRFDDLKFGNDYDIHEEDDEDDEKPRGLFRKKK